MCGLFGIVIVVGVLTLSKILMGVNQENTSGEPKSPFGLIEIVLARLRYFDLLPDLLLFFLLKLLSEVFMAFFEVFRLRLFFPGFTIREEGRNRVGCVFLCSLY